MHKTGKFLALALLAGVSTHAETEPAEAAVSERRAAFEAMTPEERRAARARSGEAGRAGGRERFRNLTDAERAAIRERREQRRAGERGRRRGANTDTSTE